MGCLFAAERSDVMISALAAHQMQLCVSTSVGMLMKSLVGSFCWSVQLFPWLGWRTYAAAWAAWCKLACV
jgi:hypothetical protein